MSPDWNEDAEPVPFATSTESDTTTCTTVPISGILDKIGQVGSQMAQVASQGAHQVANVVSTQWRRMYGVACWDGRSGGLATGVEVGSVGLIGGPAVGAVTMTGAGLINSIGAAGARFVVGMTAGPGGAANGGGKSGASSAKKVSDSQADKIAQKGGYKDAHDLKRP